MEGMGKEKLFFPLLKSGKRQKAPLEVDDDCRLGKLVGRDFGSLVKYRVAKSEMSLRFQVASVNNTTSRLGIKQLGIPFGSISFLFPDESSQGNPLPLPLNDSPENEPTLDLIIGSQLHIPTQKCLWYPLPPPPLQGKAFALGNDKKPSSRFLNFLFTFSIWLHNVCQTYV